MYKRQLPNYWESEVETIIDTVKQKHSQFGKDCVSFVFAADMHIESKNLPNYQFSQNIGKIAARVMDECDIPFMIVAGDNNSGAAVISETPEYIYAEVELQDKILKPVGIERVLKLLGNHDGKMCIRESGKAIFSLYLEELYLKGEAFYKQFKKS